jgi:hypothetical protein
MPNKCRVARGLLLLHISPTSNVYIHTSYSHFKTLILDSYATNPSTMDSSSNSDTLSPEEENTRFWSQFQQTDILKADHYSDITIVCKTGDDGRWSEVALLDQAPDSHLGGVLQITHNPLTCEVHGASACLYPIGSSPSPSVLNQATSGLTVSDFDPSGKLKWAGVVMNWREIDPSEYLTKYPEFEKAYKCEALVTTSPLEKACSAPGSVLLLSQYFHVLARQPDPEPHLDTRGAASSNPQSEEN